MSLTLILMIIVVHWIADFVLQTDKQAKGKSKNWTDLLNHTFNYSGFWMVVGIILIYNPFFEILSKDKAYHAIYFFPWITFIFHTITDYFTSRLNSKLWAKGDVHNFFVSVGFDQVLHYFQLFLTAYYLYR